MFSVETAEQPLGRVADQVQHVVSEIFANRNTARYQDLPESDAKAHRAPASTLESPSACRVQSSRSLFSPPSAKRSANFRQSRAAAPSRATASNSPALQRRTSRMFRLRTVTPLIS